MMWLGLVVGGVLGAAWWGFAGMVTLGFVGWLVGLIVSSQRASKTDSGDAKLQALADRVSELETRLLRMERGAAPVQAPEAAQQAVEQPPAPPEPSIAMGAAEAPSQAAPISAHEPVEQPDVAPKPAPKPAAPSPVVAWLTGGNAIARVGLLILFLGLGFLLKYAAEHSLIPPELRVAGVACVGIALLVFGWMWRERRRAYALGLQGGGIAVLYLTTFAALRLYGLLPPALAFALLAGIAVFSAILAVAQDALVLAAFGAGGGFLAPILASTGGGSHVMLFSYYLLLNLGIAAIAVFRSWRSLNVMGFLFTFVIGLAWGMRYYTPAYFPTTEPFLVAFFLLYVGIALLHARRVAPMARPYVDGTLVFGVPLAAFGLQAALTRDTEFGLAFSCTAASALYLVLAAAMRRRERYRLLMECFLALGVVFATMAIPFALDVKWTSAAWAVEGAAIVWVGLRQGRRVATAFGLALQLAAGGFFVAGYVPGPHEPPWVDRIFLGALLVAAAGLWTSRLLARDYAQPVRFAKQLVPLAFVWGLLWLLFAGHHDIDTYLRSPYQAPAHIAFFAATVMAFSFLATRWQWREAAWPSFALVPVLAWALAYGAIERPHPFAAGGALAWALAAFAHLWTLRRHEAPKETGYDTLQHAGGLLVFAALGALELHWWAAEMTAPFSAWTVGSVVVVPALLVLGACATAMDARWPVAGHERAYRVIAALAIVACMALWSLYANVTHDGRSVPLPYLPFLNALDLAHVLAAFTVAAIGLAWRRTGYDGLPALRKQAPAWIGAFAFLWLNAVLLRTLHHWAGIPYLPGPLLQSTLVQASLSIFWSALALALMVYSTRRAHRAVWLTGAALMAVVVLKLFVVELSHVGAVARIVSFIAVGLLMLAIGFMAPVPPRASEVRA